MTKCHILEPKHPNRATALLGGEFSGILNWNDIQFEQIYTYRESIRSHFWAISDLEDIGQSMQRLKPHQQLAIGRMLYIIIKSHRQQRVNNSYIMRYITDPSVISVMSTINDQTNERYIAAMEAYEHILPSIKDAIKYDVEKHENYVPNIQVDEQEDQNIMVLDALAALYFMTNMIHSMSLLFSNKTYYHASEPLSDVNASSIHWKTLDVIKRLQDDGVGYNEEAHVQQVISEVCNVPTATSLPTDGLGGKRYLLEDPANETEGRVMRLKPEYYLTPIDRGTLTDKDINILTSAFEIIDGPSGDTMDIIRFLFDKIAEQGNPELVKTRILKVFHDKFNIPSDPYSVNNLLKSSFLLKWVVPQGVDSL